MSLLDVARENSRSKTPDTKCTREHYQLAKAFLEGEVDSTGFRVALGCNASGLESVAWRILREGVRRGLVVVDICPAPVATLPRMCDGAIEDDEAA